MFLPFQPKMILLEIVLEFFTSAEPLRLTRTQVKNHCSKYY